MFFNNPYLKELINSIEHQQDIELNQNQIELAYMVSKWACSNLLMPTDNKCIDVFCKIDNNPRLRSYMLGIAPGFIGGSGLLLSNLISCMHPYYQLVTDEGCRIIYNHCSTLMGAIPIMEWEPNEHEIYEAAAAIRDYPEANLAADELYASIRNNVIDARPVCIWASQNSSLARYVPELTRLLCGCAYEAPASIANNVALCIRLSAEFGDNIYTPTD